MALSNLAGFPRIGPERELKFATEGYWRGEVAQAELVEAAKRIRLDNWRFMQSAGIDLIPSNDFSLYDHVLDTIALVGAVPSRYEHGSGPVGLDTYFAMARGRQESGVDVTAMEMTKWFDTNYHYIVPELGPDTSFSLSSTKPFDEHAEAMEELGIDTVPVIVGPVSFLLLGKSADGVPEDFDRLSLLEPLLEVYGELIERLAGQGATWVQLDEPCFVEDRSERELDALRLAYEELARVHERTRICVKTYFDHVGDAYGVLRDLPVEGIGLDLHRGPKNVELIANEGGLEDQWLFAGIVDGRNVWINELEHSLDLLGGLRDRCDELVVTTSCSLLHTPLDLDAEPPSDVLDDELRSWMAFARQKVGEVVTLARGLGEGREAIAGELDANDRALEDRRISQRTRNPAVRERVAALAEEDARRQSPFEVRREAQHARLQLPLFPTTTIGSYPQTAEIRQARAALRQGEIDEATYQGRMRSEVERVIGFQEEVGLDVLVHGEPERNDMVQYFAEQMEGYVFTQNAWVQSYGSRYVRPPILFGDVDRPAPMTTDWIAFAQSLTPKPVKGMLTGPRDHAPVVVRSRRPGAVRDLRAARARDPRRGRRPRGAGDQGDPGGRAGDPRGIAAAPGPLERVPGVGGPLLPDRDLGGQGRDPDPHAHVLLGLRRHHGADPADGRRRAADRGGAQPHGAAPRLGAHGLCARDRAGRLRHPLTARPTRRGDGRAAGGRGARAASRAALGQPGLRAEDPRLAGDRGRPPQPRPGRQAGPGRAGPGDRLARARARAGCGGRGRW